MLHLALGCAAAGAAVACSSADDPASDQGDLGADHHRLDGGAGDASTGPVAVQILAFNDFHGNLLPPSPTNGAILAKVGDPLVANDNPVNNGDGTETVQAGGAAYFAARLKKLRALNPHTLVVSSGDLTGAAPLLSNAYADEPTIDVFNTVVLDVEGVGNHDFDNGAPGVLRLQKGGCNPATDIDAGFGELGSCEISPTFKGANFEYLAANVNVVDAGAADVPDGGPTSGTLFPPYSIREVGGVKIAFIGMTLNATPTIVSGGLPGLQFADEVTTANALVATLKGKVDVIAVLLHQGGFQTGTYNDCVGLTGTEIDRIAAGLDPAVSFIHSAHTHQAYNCILNGRPVAQAGSYGRIITQYDLSVDPVAHKVLSVVANNIPVTRDITPDPLVQKMVDTYVADLAPLAGQVEGYISGDITKLPGVNGEAPLGDVITDAMKWAANKAVVATPGLLPAGAQVDVAFTNIGGIRDGLFYDTSGFITAGDGGTLPSGQVTYQQTQAIEPFGDVVDLVQCTGAQLIAVVQQNVYQPASLQLLQQSGLTYSWSPSAAQDGGMGGADPSSFAIVHEDGSKTPLDPAGTYYIAGLTFFTSGGDGYTAFGACTQLATIGTDLDIFDSYLQQTTATTQPLAVPPANRITVTGLPLDGGVDAAQ
jgi:5'-nucleotidase